MSARLGRPDWLMEESARDTSEVVHAVLVSGTGCRSRLPPASAPRSTTSTGGDTPVESLVTVAHAAHRMGELHPEYRTAVELATRPISIAEIGAALRVPVGVARVL